MSDKEFTIENYETLLRLAKSKYRFCSFHESTNEPHILWRHDIDFSVHRAVRMANIEAKIGVKSTYFVMLTSSFYNLMEPAIVERIKIIQKLGHQIGLHFDLDFFQKDSDSDWEKNVKSHKTILQEVLDAEVLAVSIHNPTNYPVALWEKETIAGMVNVFSKRLREQYIYCSDSNGYWRFRNLSETLTENHERLHVLTHPAWWTEKAMSPREKIKLCIEGRAKNCMMEYDLALQQYGRKNIGLEKDGE